MAVRPVAIRLVCPNGTGFGAVVSMWGASGEPDGPTERDWLEDLRQEDTFERDHFAFCQCHECGERFFERTDLHCPYCGAERSEVETVAEYVLADSAETIKLAKEVQRLEAERDEARAKWSETLAKLDKATRRVVELEGALERIAWHEFHHTSSGTLNAFIRIAREALASTPQPSEGDTDERQARIEQLEKDYFRTRDERDEARAELKRMAFRQNDPDQALIDRIATLGGAMGDWRNRALTLEGALERIGQMSHDGTGRLRPIWSKLEMVKIAREALVPTPEGDA